MQPFVIKWVTQEFSETERGMEMLLVRPGESLPRKQALSAISGHPPGVQTSEQGPSHIWHRGLAEAARSQPRRWGDGRLNERRSNVTDGVSVRTPGKRLAQCCSPGMRRLGGQRVLPLVSPCVPWTSAEGGGCCHRPVVAAHGRYTKPHGSSLWHVVAFKITYFILT